MSSEIKLVIYGNPVPQGRPRFARVGKYVHTYDPEKSKNYKQLVRLWVTQHLKNIDGFKPLQKAVCVDLTFYLGIPISWSKKKRIEADNGLIRPIVKPDTDNLVKSVTDSCNGLLWAEIPSLRIYTQKKDTRQDKQEWKWLCVRWNDAKHRSV